MSDSWSAEDHAIARAIDAASEADTTAADVGLVDEYREVLSQVAEIAVAKVTPRAELEDSVVAAALARRPATVPTLDRNRAKRFNRLRVFALGAATVAAAVVVGLIVHGGSSTAPAPGGRVALATQQRTDVTALVRTAGARTGTFSGGNGHVVITRAGTGAVYGLAGDGAVSIGLVASGATTTLGPAVPGGRVIAFTVDHPERVTAVTLSRNGAEIARAPLSSS